MKFDIKQVHEYLKNNGIVYTVRSYEQNENFSVVQVNNVGHCMKSKICKIESLKDLVPYTGQSGFKTAQDWYKTFKAFGHTEGWLYKVEVLEDEFTPLKIVPIPQDELDALEMDHIRDLAAKEWQQKIYEDYEGEAQRECQNALGIHCTDCKYGDVC